MALLAVTLTALGFAGSASAELTGAYTKFQFCPWTDAEAEKCTYAVTEGGEVKLGSKTVPIVNPVVLQGGITEPVPKAGGEISKFIAATNGVTLSKAPQPVPGGLLGLVPPAGAPLLVKLLLQFALENGLTGVNSTLELARPASEIEISEGNLAEGERVALLLPLKARLENPILGNSCYVGSSASPIYWKLTTGVTDPPGPNESITGDIGSVDFLEGGLIIEITDNVLVDNAWSAPAASGCGGVLSPLIDPIIGLQLGSTTAGNNTAILENTLFASPAFAVKQNNDDNL